MAKKKEVKKLSGRELKRLSSRTNKAGQPRTFDSGEYFLSLFDEFLLFIREAINFSKMPTRSNFKSWLGEYKNIYTDYKTIYLTINQYYPEIKTTYLQMLEDTLSEGAALDKYKANMIIFCLKNWCGWSDKNDVSIGNKDGQAFRIELAGELDDWSK